MCLTIYIYYSDIFTVHILIYCINYILIHLLLLLLLLFGILLVSFFFFFFFFLFFFFFFLFFSFLLPFYRLSCKQMILNSQLAEDMNLTKKELEQVGEP